MNPAAVIELIACLWEMAGDWQGANWIRSQTQEIEAATLRGEVWPELVKGPRVRYGW